MYTFYSYIYTHPHSTVYVYLSICSVNTVSRWTLIVRYRICICCGVRIGMNWHTAKARHHNSKQCLWWVLDSCTGFLGLHFLRCPGLAQSWNFKNVQAGKAKGNQLSEGLTKFSTMLKERLVTCAPLRCLWTYLIMFGHSDKSSLYHACPCLFYSDSGLRPYCACHRTAPGKRNDRMCKLARKSN